MKLVASREQEFNTLPSRQGLKSRIKTGVSADGKLLAFEATYYWDAGAYADYGVNIGRASATGAAGPYEIPNCRIDSLVVYTHKLFGTAFRGFGHLEVLWGVERNMDLIAEAMGWDPLEFRLKNVLRAGASTITGEKVTANHGRPDLCLEHVAPGSRVCRANARQGGHHPLRQGARQGSCAPAQGAGHAGLHLVLGVHQVQRRTPP